MTTTSKICLCLNGKTIKEDLALIEKYRKYIDIVELRADYLDEDEKLYIRKFPSIANIPAILTIRRRCDGGKFQDGEASRTTLFAMGISFADKNPYKNFAYIDLESDFDVPSIQDAAFAFGTKIIRSYHNMYDYVSNLQQAMLSLRKTGFEIPKIACMAKSLDDVTTLMTESAKIKDYEHITIAMGSLGQPSRILSSKINSCITYVKPEDEYKDLTPLGQIDPVTLNDVYHFREIDSDTKIFGITGYPLKVTSSPAIHNAGFKSHGMNCVYIPIRAQNVDEVKRFAAAFDVKGISVTVPFKESIMENGFLKTVSEVAGNVQAANTIIKKDDDWYGYNTDVAGFMKSFKEFLGTDSLFLKRVSIIGAGGAAKAIAYAVKKMRGKACIFNRTVSKAQKIAEFYGFKFAPLSADYISMLDLYSDVIIQTTSVGLGIPENIESNSSNDPIYFYNFKGYEKVFDLIYEPKKTPILARAEKAGCDICNGKNMLNYQAYEQFELFTGKKYF